MTLPPHLAFPPLSDLAMRVLSVIAERTMQRGTGGYIASWNISNAIPGIEDLDVACSFETPGNAAMRELKRAGLVEDVPDLGLRYRLTALGVAWVALRDAQALYDIAQRAAGHFSAISLAQQYPQYEAERKKPWTS